MPTSSIPWFQESHLKLLFLNFPLPLLLLDKAGVPIAQNLACEREFPGDETEKTDWQALLQASANPNPEPTFFYYDASQEKVYVHSMSFGGSTIMVLEKSTQFQHDPEIRLLQQRIHELERSNASDRLTGAWNRAHFEHIIHVELSRSVRYHQPISLIFFDIDHFKHVNDTYGHSVGDQVLRELVKVIKNNIRTSDMLFRWGGEEFALLTTSTHFHAAEKLAHILRAKIAEHPMPAVEQITISLGVAEYLSGEDQQSWFERADQALYQAKNSGRNRVVVDARGNSSNWEAEAQDTLSIMRMQWHDSYLCGHALIDQEHLELFELANRLLDSSVHRAENPVAFIQAMEILLTHVAKHFADEEAILGAQQYADLEVHIRAHKRLLERAMQLKEAALEGTLSTGELVDFLADELVARHMQNSDRQYYPLFNH